MEEIIKNAEAWLQFTRNSNMFAVARIHVEKLLGVIDKLSEEEEVAEDMIDDMSEELDKVLQSSQRLVLQQSVEKKQLAAVSNENFLEKNFGKFFSDPGIKKPDLYGPA